MGTRNGIFWSILRSVFGRFKVLVFKRRLASRLRHVTDIPGFVDVSYSSGVLGLSIAPYQVREEITELLMIVDKLKPKVVLEIGTASGGTLFLFTRVSDDEACLISVDLPGGAFGGGYPRWMASLYSSFARKDQRIHLVRADSHEEATKRTVEKILEGKKVDLLFVDGDHSLEGVQKDFEVYRGLVRKGGIIAMHDIVRGKPEIVGGVPDFWRRITEQSDHSEIVMDWNQGGFGIGILRV